MTRDHARGLTLGVPTGFVAGYLTRDFVLPMQLEDALAQRRSGAR